MLIVNISNNMFLCIYSRIASRRLARVARLACCFPPFCPSYLAKQSGALLELFLIVSSGSGTPPKALFYKGLRGVRLRAVDRAGEMKLLVLFAPGFRVARDTIAPGCPLALALHLRLCSYKRAGIWRKWAFVHIYLTFFHLFTVVFLLIY